MERPLPASSMPRVTSAPSHFQRIVLVIAKIEHGISNARAVYREVDQGGNRDRVDDDSREVCSSVTPRAPFQREPDSFDDPIRLLKAAAEHSLEGIVSKRLDAPYRSGNRSSWTKVKTPRWRAANQRRLEAIRNSFRR